MAENWISVDSIFESLDDDRDGPSERMAKMVEESKRAIAREREANERAKALKKSRTRVRSQMPMQEF